MGRGRTGADLPQGRDAERHGDRGRVARAGGVRRRVGIALGSCGPTIIRAAEAERFASGLFDEGGWEKALSPNDAARTELGRLVASAARPIDDVRGTAAYRRQVLSVIAARALSRVATVA